MKIVSGKSKCLCDELLTFTARRPKYFQPTFVTVPCKCGCRYLVKAIKKQGGVFETEVKILELSDLAKEKLRNAAG
jgi:hypothetical protein